MNKTTTKILSFSISLGIVYWFIAALYDYYLFDKKFRFLLLQSPSTFFDSFILNVPQHDLFARISFMLACIIGGLLVSILLNERIKAEEKLKKAHDELDFRIAERTQELLESNKKLQLEIEVRALTEFELAKRVAFEHLISKISSDFVGLSVKETDAGIENALKIIGMHSGADRVYVFQFKDKNEVMNNTHEWCAEGIEPQIKNLQNISLNKELPWFAHCIRNRETFYMPDLNALPAEAQLEKKHFSAQGIQSLIVVPMLTMGDRMVGFLGIDAVEDRQQWSDDVQILLKIVGETFAHALARKEAEEEREKLETQLMRSQKMESLGLLAGSVAHDLNNILSGIVSYPELLLLNLPEDSKLRRPIKIIHESGNRAAAIVQDLLTIARGVAITKKPINISTLLNDYLNSPEFKKLQQLYPGVAIKTSINDNLFNILGSYVHCRKLIMNLVSNAFEAIEGTGIVSISTMTYYIDKPLEGYEYVKIGEYVVLMITDDGPGILPNDLERIFEPFYTKKIMGRSGTGLGLSVVWNVVKDHNGYINIKSDKTGSQFELYFPITRNKVSDNDSSLHPHTYKGNGETILVVDDMENQREISCNMLEALGYKCSAVSSGEEAVEYLKKQTVDLLLLDMVMEPGIDGRETYERIIKIHPNQKAIIYSGFAETEAVLKIQQLGAGQYIKKPISLEKLGFVIKNELNKSGKQ